MGLNENKVGALKVLKHSLSVYSLWSNSLFWYFHFVSYTYLVPGSIMQTGLVGLPGTD